ncbi:putative RNA methyltransferase [Phyllosticta citriasiana]|uniref:RNA methyltransferase n=1 Tax=Phyllosticta citriasiana TaxID=595635 RepID=A0ABR1KJB7_9PEZI
MASHSQSKKRKRNNVVVHQAGTAAAASSGGADTSKPTAVFKPTKGRSCTLSIALPGSIIANAQSHDLKTAMAGAIARAAAVFSVDEVIIFNDGQSQKHNAERQKRYSNDYYNDRRRQDEASGYTGFSDPDNFLYHMLSYLETPPHLRKALFPLHPNLRTAGTLPSLDMPHHLRADEWCQYREGVVSEPSSYMDNAAQHGDPTLNKKRKKKQRDGEAPNTTAGAAVPVWVDAGLPSPVRLDPPASIPPHSRVTLKFADEDDPGAYDDLVAEAVDPSAPREETGLFWGYQTRPAGSLSAVFTECPWDGGYDVSVGTSERGVVLSSLLTAAGEPAAKGGGGSDAEAQGLPQSFQHLLLVFGGVAGLEVAANADPELAGKGIDGKTVGGMFDAWVNLVPNQGSRTIRTEEAVWLGLMGLREYARRNAGET